MILTTHALVGAAVGKYVGNPWLIVTISLPLHFLLDTFRHGEYLGRKSSFRSTWWKVALDLLLGLGIVGGYVAFSDSSAAAAHNILLGTFASMFPDLLTVLYWKLGFKFLHAAFKFHEWVHPYPKGDKRYDWNLRNAANDIIFSIIALLILVI